MLYERLLKREASGTPIRVGIIGAGTFGTQITAQLCKMQGIRASVVAELSLERAVGAFQTGGVEKEQIQVCETTAALNHAIREDQPAVTTSTDQLFDSQVEVIVEATGIPELAVHHACRIIDAQKHIVMVSVEADILVGHSLRKQAEDNGVMYSMAYGDEPALALELVDWAQTLGFRVVAAGKGTRFKPDFRKANPDDVARLYGFTGEDYNPKMFGSFLDGTKHSIEMAALSNASGLIPDQRGMHFPALELSELPDVFCSKQHGGILNQEGVVDVVSSIHPDDRPVQNNLRGGLFAVIASDDDYHISSLASYGEITGMFTSHDNKRAVIYRPQHFVGHEMPITIARMMLLNETSGKPMEQISDVIAVAKKTLKPGMLLDGEGGYTVYGLIEQTVLATKEQLVPIGLTGNAEVIHEIKEDEPVRFQNVKLQDSLALQLRNKQNSTP
jgi:predicted homoserine dehydrogenase-like protein